ncbi:hypothetical protein LTR84_003155 [Exophiala bonariae]|uniref:Transcription factor domain-containing protein n=1 Tax=Exophiala bonariae TaxID=1690606 RepID=A0AAV9N8B3_9EURO|nr:hypothetical protein LTR84_003155 [Exophiala bonariae]
MAERTCDQSDLIAANLSAQGMGNPRSSDHATDAELPASIRSTIHDLDMETQALGHFDEISRVLLKLWPSQNDLEIALSIPVDISMFSHGIICVPYAKFIAEKLSSPHNVLQLPPQGSHPIIIARRLLMLATFFLSVPPRYSSELAKMTCDPQSLMSRIVDIVHGMVTSNDELVNSLEGIECLMIESMFRNNAGSLRRAWLTNRRAISIAQLMGLDKPGTATVSSMIVEESTRARVDLDVMWFRLVCSDGYLSLILGMTRSAYSDHSTYDSTILRKRTPLEQFERVETAIGGFIMWFNQFSWLDFMMTSDHDRSLRQASEMMPAKWWLMGPDISVLMGNDEDALEESVRLTCHFTHYHLLLQLHLPYLLRSPSGGQDYTYSKLTAAHASRTILTQYLHFRNTVATVTYCRGIDFIVFIASTTLCVAHIEARRQQKFEAADFFLPLGTIMHQRQSDRGLLESALQMIQTIALENNDAIASKIKKILEPLLDIELESFKGKRYLIHATRHGSSRKPDSEVDNDQEVRDGLLIDIPQYGSIRFEPERVRQGDDREASLSGEELAPGSHFDDSAAGGVIVCGHAFPPFDSGNANAGEASSRSFNWEDALKHNNPSFGTASGAPLEEVGVAYVEDFLDTNSGTTTDEWSLQNVDAALFSGLIRGCVAPTLESWK